MLLLDGKKVRDEIKKTLRRRITSLPRKPKLAIIHVGDREESLAYIRQKKIFGESLGALVEMRPLSSSGGTDAVIREIETLNIDSSVCGIIVQLPLDGMDRNKIINAIEPQKDVDGLTEINKLMFREGKPRFIPATARGIVELLEHYHVNISGRKIVVLGRSELVGGPTAFYLQRKGGEVDVCHSGTPDIKKITRRSDIIVVAIGKPGLIGRDYFRNDQSQTVVDVGITAVTKSGRHPLTEEIPRKKLCGDVDFDEVKEMVYAISPVPGGVGPMTVAALFENLLAACELQRKTI